MNHTPKSQMHLGDPITQSKPISICAYGKPKSMIVRHTPSPPTKSFPTLRVLESNFPGDSLYNSTDMRIPTP